MRVPGFSAGAAVYKTDGHYHVSGVPGGESARYGLVESALGRTDWCISNCSGPPDDPAVAACVCRCVGGRFEYHPYLPPPHGICVFDSWGGPGS